MKKIIKLLPLLAITVFAMSCNNQETTVDSTTDATATMGGQESVQDDESQKDIVKVAVGSPDHTTLVAALTQAEYVDDLTNVGPFTVFAPTNEAFNKLPAGTVEGLMKNDKKGDLQNILEYHVSIGVFKQDMMRDGQLIDQANNKKIIISKDADGKIKINGTANILGEVKASNGLVYVIDEVLLPPAKQ
jgi:uncharacterized surface protein with fasciclin (FAS1) repeats